LIKDLDVSKNGHIFATLFRGKEIKKIKGV